MSLRPSYPARRAARAPRASARSRSVQASAPIAAVPRANRALRSSRAESATARAASWRRAGACFARLPVLPSSPCALLRALRRAPQASEPPLVAAGPCAVCSGPARCARTAAPFIAPLRRAAARLRALRLSLRALGPLAPRVGCAGARLFAVGRRGLWPRLGLGWSAPRNPCAGLRVRRGAHSSHSPPFGASSAAPPRGRGRCGARALSRGLSVGPARFSPPPVRAAGAALRGALRSGGRGRARAARACPRLRPRPLGCVSGLRPAVPRRCRAAVSPLAPSRPSSPLGTEGGVRPAALRAPCGACSAAAGTGATLRHCLHMPPVSSHCNALSRPSKRASRGLDIARCAEGITRRRYAKEICHVQDNESHDRSLLRQRPVD